MTPTYAADKWNALVTRIDDIFKLNPDKTIRLPCSFGKKSMVVLFAALSVSTDFDVIHVETRRHSEVVRQHALDVIGMLENRGVDVTIKHVVCKKTIAKRSMNGCPAMLFLKSMPKHTVDVLASTDKVYVNPLINAVKHEFHSHTRRYFPVRYYDADVLNMIHERYVPVAYRFPIGCICTCNTPICPVLHEEVSDEVLNKYTDWSYDF